MKAVFFGWIMLVLLAVVSIPGFSQTAASDAEVDASALQELQTFLMDSVARKAFSDKTPQGAQVNNYVVAFPDYAQKELMEIVMMIMRESGTGAMKHVDTHKKQGSEATMSSFSPAVKARVEALTEKLKKDPQFNNPQNLEKMKQKMPNVGGKSS